MGWVKMPHAKIPEEDGMTVTYAITQEGDVSLLGYGLLAQQQKEIYELMVAARETADEAGDDPKADAFEEAMGIVRKFCPDLRL